MEYFDIKKIHAGKITDESIPVSEEVPLTIEINGKELSTLLCSPVDLENLITGFLYTSGFFNDISSIKNIIIDRQQWKANVEMDSPELPEDFAFKRIYTSGCGKGIVFHNPLDIMNQEKIEDNYKVKSSSIENLRDTETRTRTNYGCKVPNRLRIYEYYGRHLATSFAPSESVFHRCHQE